MAMRLVLDQMHLYPLPVIIGYLKQANQFLQIGSIEAQEDGNRLEHPTYQFYSFIYKPSCDSLNVACKTLLLSMARIPSNSEASLEDIIQISGLPVADFYPSVANLIRLC